MVQKSVKINSSSNSNVPTQYPPDSVVVRGRDYNLAVDDITVDQLNFIITEIK